MTKYKHHQPYCVLLRRSYTLQLAETEEATTQRLISSFFSLRYVTKHVQKYLRVFLRRLRSHTDTLMQLQQVLKRKISHPSPPLWSESRKEANHRTHCLLKARR